MGVDNPRGTKNDEDDKNRKPFTHTNNLLN